MIFHIPFPNVCIYRCLWTISVVTKHSFLLKTYHLYTPVQRPNAKKKLIPKPWSTAPFVTQPIPQRCYFLFAHHAAIRLANWLCWLVWCAVFTEKRNISWHSDKQTQKKSFRNRNAITTGFWTFFIACLCACFRLNSLCCLSTQRFSYTTLHFDSSLSVDVDAVYKCNVYMFYHVYIKRFKYHNTLSKIMHSKHWWHYCVLSRP